MAQIEPFGSLPDGRRVDAIMLRSDAIAARILTYGARLTDLRVDEGPSVTVGSEDLADYGPGASLEFCGPVIGPVLNRISGAQANLDGERLTFEANVEGRLSLHSGSAGTHRAIWNISEVGPSAVTLFVELPHGEGGFPGNRRIGVTYRLGPGPSISIGIWARTDRPTVLNVGHHPYWNLDGTDSWKGHRLTVHASHYLPVDADFAATGEIELVEGTEYDLREGALLGTLIDNNYCLDARASVLIPAAELIGSSGRGLRLATSAPGLQVFTGQPYGVALEPQMWPNAPSHKRFPSIVIREFDCFRQDTRIAFFVI
ncbi:MAG: aldose epimerase family protein [Pseudomonadota bacterium]